MHKLLASERREQESHNLRERVTNERWSDMQTGFSAGLKAVRRFVSVGAVEHEPLDFQ